MVTGGAGFIGSHLVDRLVDEGYFVKVIDNLSTGNLKNIRKHLDSGCVEFVKGDIRKIKQVKQAVNGVDYVFHLAAMTRVPLSVRNPSLTFNVNVSGTVHLLRISADTNVKKFIFASSCAVYGDPHNMPINEDESTNPISPYAQSKLASEHFCMGFYKTGLLKTVLLRIFNVYGPRQILNDYSGVITKFINNVDKHKPLIIYGDGSQTRDFINVSDVVVALVDCMKNEKADGQIFNIGSGKQTTIQDLAKTVLKLNKSEAKIKNKEMRKGDIKYSYADSSKASNLLGYNPKIKLKDGLQDLIDSLSV